MKCPHCNYDTEINDDYGEFYRLPVELTRQSDSMLRIEDDAYLYACPACKKVFILD